MGIGQQSEIIKQREIKHFSLLFESLFFHFLTSWTSLNIFKLFDLFLPFSQLRKYEFGRKTSIPQSIGANMVRIDA